jgi:hypothetical protein
MRASSKQKKSRGLILVALLNLLLTGIYLFLALHEVVSSIIAHAGWLFLLVLNWAIWIGDMSQAFSKTYLEDGSQTRPPFFRHTPNETQNVVFVASDNDDEPEWILRWGDVSIHVPDELGRPEAAAEGKASKIVKSGAAFQKQLDDFLRNESKRFYFGHYEDEIALLEPTDIYFYTSLSSKIDGELHFKGGFEGRCWRCEMSNSEFNNLGFDS